MSVFTYTNFKSVFKGSVFNRTLFDNTRPIWQTNLLSMQLPPNTVVSRATVGTVVDYQGVYQDAAIDTPRFDRHPVTFQPCGLLIEEQRTNLFIRSNDFTAYSYDRASATSNALTTPSVPLDMAKVVETVTTGAHDVYTTYAYTANTNTVYSVHLKQGERRYARIQVGVLAGGSAAYADIDLQTGTAVNSGVYGTGFTFRNIEIRTMKNGVYRVLLAWSYNANSTLYPAIILRDTNTNVSPLTALAYTGDGTSGIYMAGFQMESGTSFGSSYIPTTGTSVTRSADNIYLLTSNMPGFNSTQGTLFSEYEIRAGYTGTAEIAVFSDNTVNNYMVLARTAANGQTTWGGASGGVLSWSPALTPSFIQGVHRVAGAYQAKNCVHSLDGTLGTLDTSTTIPTVNRFEFGSIANTLHLNGWLREIRYFGSRLSDSEVRRMTSL